MHDPQHDPLQGLDPHLVRTLSGVQLLALDVDGTLTDGGVRYAGDQEQMVFDVHDGQGLAWVRRVLGVRVALLTGRGCEATERRARELGIEAYRPRCGPKDVALAAVQEELGVQPDATLAMGDDLPDLAMARRAGLFVAPASARPEVRLRAQVVTRASAGHGAVRDVCDWLLAAAGRWGELVDGAGRCGD